MHFVHSLNEGGIERLLLELCNKTNKQKFEIQICCLVEKGILAAQFESAGIQIHFVNAQRDFSVNNIAPNFFVLIKIIKLLRKKNINITHGHEFFSTVFSRIAGVAAGIKKNFITLHNSYTWWGKGVHKTQKLLSYITTGIICNSKATLEYSLLHDRIKSEKYILIYNGIDCNRFMPKESSRKNFCEALKINESRFICMTVGSISPRKGLEYLIKAASILNEEFPDMVYVIVGGKHANEGSEFNRITDLFSDLNLESNIFITGSRNDISEILNYCDLYVMPSVVEGFGLALAEAMAEEKICIASDIAPFREILEDGENGFLFKTEDSIALAEKIKKVRVMSDDDLDKIKKRARVTIVDKFNSDTMIKNYEELYL
ncbi:MAG: glycosyltransferase [bacterium]